MEAIICALITGACTVVAVIITNTASHRKTEQQIEKAQAITDVKLEALTREVREHNNFAKRMPVVEEQVKVINHRIADLEHKIE